jgi:hypothetical protein
MVIISVIRPALLTGTHRRGLGGLVQSIPFNISLVMPPTAPTCEFGRVGAAAAERLCFE